MHRCMQKATWMPAPNRVRFPPKHHRRRKWWGPKHPKRSRRNLSCTRCVLCQSRDPSNSQGRSCAAFMMGALITKHAWVMISWSSMQYTVMPGSWSWCCWCCRSIVGVLFMATATPRTSEPREGQLWTAVTNLTANSLLLIWTQLLPGVRSYSHNKQRYAESKPRSHTIWKARLHTTVKRNICELPSVIANSDPWQQLNPIVIP